MSALYTEVEGQSPESLENWGLVDTNNAAGAWLTPTDAGYFALGWDEFVGGDVPVWSMRGKDGKSAAVVTAAGLWVMEATEFEGKRRARIFYMTDSGQVEGCDIEITTGSGITRG